MLGDLATPALVLGADPGALPEGVTYGRPGAPVPTAGGPRSCWRSPTRPPSAMAVSALPDLGRAKHVACHLGSAAGPVTTVLRPEWPPLAHLNAETPDGGALTRMTFRRPAPAAAVLVELARHTGTPAVTGNHGLVVDGVATPMDPTSSPTRSRPRSRVRDRRGDRGPRPARR